MALEGERPLECTGCQKPVEYVYKEIANGSITTHCMCQSCPIYEQKIHGSKSEDSSPGEEKHDLYCERCGTSMAALRRGELIGCELCYHIFEDILRQELVKSKSISPRMMPTIEQRKSMPLHIGNSPEERTEVSLSQKIGSMNEALNDALTKENYEQAAWLRDQIKTLMNPTNDGKNATP